jgi:hypothetical protein
MLREIRGNLEKNESFKKPPPLELAEWLKW